MFSKKILNVLVLAFIATAGGLALSACGAINGSGSSITVGNSGA